MGGPIIEARFGGMGAGWRTPSLVPGILREYGYDPDLFLCNRYERLSAVTVDTNVKWRPTVLADMNALPFKDGAFRCGFFDPPYDVPYRVATNELLRVCRERAAVLHVRDVSPGYGRIEHRGSAIKRAWTREASILLLCGNDSMVRCLNLFRRRTEAEAQEAGDRWERRARRRRKVNRRSPVRMNLIQRLTRDWGTGGPRSRGP